MSPTVELLDLRCLKDVTDDLDVRTALTQLAADDHVHGNLRIVFSDGHVLFNYGFYGQSDACIGDWLITLHELADMLSGIDDFNYEYPFPDQGDPTLEFAVSADEVTIRLNHYESDPLTSPHSMDPKKVSREEFSEFVDTVIRLISDTIMSASPKAGSAWLARHKNE